MTAAFFGLSGLDLIGALDSEVSDSTKKEWIEWIYAQQVMPDPSNLGKTEPMCGFSGGPWGGAQYDPCKTCSTQNPYNDAHLAMTYTALASLLILGDDLSRVNKKAVVRALRHLQTPSGCFMASHLSGELDMRFLFSACAISFMLDDWSGVDKDRAVSYILKSQGVQCVRWLLQRQEDGFAGRPGKPADTCYSFWVGASLKILDSYNFIDSEAHFRFLKTTASPKGGFSKLANGYPGM
ncbi:Geranylgeranyl transferase type-1 subunit beta [Blyttiomyces sp. JEL0837]|nr:Geranylgeranyl transferase type-1 subunit beta [Blyttiomyces sp. JEL0837]